MEKLEGRLGTLDGNNKLPEHQLSRMRQSLYSASGEAGGSNGNLGRENELLKHQLSPVIQSL